MKINGEMVFRNMAKRGWSSEKILFAHRFFALGFFVAQRILGRMVKKLTLYKITSISPVSKKASEKWDKF